ncbi:MAG TPA: metallophosphoesterase [Thermoanaerobaculia bacterium]|jgi:DNA repair exonuclease SbcCD nuclease subunit
MPIVRAGLPPLLIALVAIAGCTGLEPPAPRPRALPEVECASGAAPPAIAGPAGRSIQIAALGDAGEGPEERGSHLNATIAAVKKLGTVDAVLLLGDNVYRCGVRDTADPNWQRVIAPLFAIGRPVYPVLGNHDWGSKATPGCTFSNPEAQIAKTGQPGFEQWQFPAANYVVRTDVAELVMFDSSPIAYSWPEQRSDPLCALRAVLARPKTTPWRVVVAHHPMYSCGDHGNDQSTLTLRAALHELFESSGVDLYLTGHDHDLEIASAPGRTMHVVSGSASKIRKRGAKCREGESFRIEGGFALLDVSDDALDVRFYCNGESEPCIERSITPREPSLQ